tara:strand:- start:96 stop:419 length:324 start_codon:yes stop_codon:yes gene_type:complete
MSNNQITVKERQGRGMLTARVQKKANELLGRPITVKELRLYPYIQYTMMNSQALDPAHMNQDDRNVLARLRCEGHIEGGASGLQITKEFWDIMNEIIFLGYVDLFEV